MARAWLLLFGLLALGRCQIIFPDQYEIMKAANPAYMSPSNGRDSNSNNQPIQNEEEYVPQYVSAAQAAPVLLGPLLGASQTSYYPSTPFTTPASRQPSPQNWGTHVNNIIARSITKFSLDLDRAIYNTRETSVASHRENSIFSPLSIGVALSLVLLGSAGRTFDEVSRVLGLETGIDISQHSEIVHQMFGMLLNNVNYRVEGDRGPRVSSASGIFVQEGFPIRPEFRVISENAYKSEVINLDFRRKGIEAMDTINNWVKQRTMEKISSILSDVPNPSTNVILASALYFNGEWNQHFLNTATKKKPFFIEPNESVQVNMMFNGGPFPFYEDKSLGVKLLQLPYKKMEMSMYILLPKAEGATALRNFSNQLTPEIIEYLISNLKNETCVIGLPRMKLSSSLNLKRALYSLGLRSLFEPNSSDLSILSSGYGSLPVTASTTRPYVNPQTVLPQTVIPFADSQVTQTITSNVTPLPQTLSQRLPQNASRALPLNSQPQLSQVLSQARPEALSQTLPQAVYPLNNFLIFPRFGSDDSRNIFRYDDKRTGLTVEQWATGFHIRKIRRIRRNTVDERNDDASRLTYVANEKHDDLRRSDGSNPSMKFVNLEENKYRFRNADEQKRVNRKRRQTRPMDQSFLDFIQSQNFPSYGLDNLRNNAQLTNPGLFADEVLHKVEMDVTERGTEAAATTAVTLQRDGNQKRLIASRPFLFFIRHDPTKLILFWGTINTPTPNFPSAR